MKAFRNLVFFLLGLVTVMAWQNQNIGLLIVIGIVFIWGIVLVVKGEW
jgi:hypothetical protein